MTNLMIRCAFILLFFVGLLPLNSEAQSRKRLKELEKTEERQQGDALAAEEEARQRHLEIQSKQTKKEMRRYKKKSKRYNKNRKEPFFKRRFRRNKR